VRRDRRPGPGVRAGLGAVTGRAGTGVPRTRSRGRRRATDRGRQGQYWLMVARRGRGAAVRCRRDPGRPECAGAGRSRRGRGGPGYGAADRCLTRLVRPGCGAGGRFRWGRGGLGYEAAGPCQSGRGGLGRVAGGRCAWGQGRRGCAAAGRCWPDADRRGCAGKSRCRCAGWGRWWCAAGSRTGHATAGGAEDPLGPRRRQPRGGRSIPLSPVPCRRKDGSQGKAPQAGPKPETVCHCRRWYRPEPAGTGTFGTP